MTGSTSAGPTQSGTQTYSNTQPWQGESAQWRAHAEPHPHDSHSGVPHQRIEPRLDEPGVARPNIGYEQLHGLGPDFGEYRPPVRSRLRRVTTMLAVFVVGAGVGLAAAWWLHRSAPAPQVAVMPASPARMSSAVPGTDSRRPLAVRGISPSELPYDGAPPSHVPEPTQPRQAVVSPPPSETPNMTSGGAGSVVQSDSGGAEKSVASPGERHTSAEESAALVVSGKAAKESAAAEADDAPKSVKGNKQSSTSVAGVAPKRKSVPRLSDREIERIRKQVDEELKKKSEHGRAPGDLRNGASLTNPREGARKVTAASQVSREALIRATLARCERNTNLFRREFCRWQVCNGSWGRHGCPSYKPHTPNY